ncbi:uncharacterized protein PODANS_2_6655 [Podospora anserina S mat+]|uniref:Podospora anserina S mat+ genomic DNA chromosome 2, supercontig 2 n=1 Tax=Podospora anserina (strain S / ATCC MYA-4624 / DSM 980 / FGSC 10383) TaxID=515849 RepID=B2B642_PODAN|nr:uncharacterized protein PODANS_2_6655 [Podospora anserina S mat+]CAP73267.1 unnamed protein product [Podospora anserina S mat+]CDP25668.1 Putative protein of unknown function [Podospora anserina S mat+]
MFTTKNHKTTKPQPQPQPQQVAIQDGQVIGTSPPSPFPPFKPPTNPSQGVLIRRTSTWKKLKTTTTKAVKVVTPNKRTAAPPPGREYLRRAKPTGENQSFYRSSYLALNPQRQWDLYIAGLAPQGVPAPRGPPPPQKGVTPRQFKTVNVMYLTKPSPSGVQAGTISYLPDAFEVAKGKKKIVKNPNPDALPAFPTPGQGKVVVRPVKQGQGQQQQQKVRVSTQAQGRPVQQAVRVQQQPQLRVRVQVQQQQQQQYVQVAVPVTQVQRPQTQQFVAVPVGQVQQQVVRPVSQVVQRPVQQQQRQQRPQTQFVTVPVQHVQRPQQQQQQFVVLQTVAQPQPQQQVVMIPAVNTQPVRQQVRTGGMRVPGQSVVTVRA